MENELMPLKT